MKAVISDTSCLILYTKLELLDILKNTFRVIYVTQEVADEYGDPLPSWIKVKKIKNKKVYLELRQDLGRGEASSIVLAKELGQSLLIIDEKRGRKIAKRLNVTIIGSLGVLLKAKDRGVIDAVRDILDAINQTNFRISYAIKEELLKKAKEV